MRRKGLKLLGKNILKGKHAVVTGATGGLGREISFNLAQNGCYLFITGRDKDKLKEVKCSMSEVSTLVEAKAGDLQNSYDIECIINEIKKKLPKVDILINNAGVFPIKSLSASNIKDFEDCFQVNVRAPFLLCQAFAPEMAKRRWGRIVNIGSSSAYSGFKNTAIYCASKHALLGMTRAIHDEYKNNNVRVFCVSPGSIRTKMGKLTRDQDYETFIDPAEIAQYISFIISYDSQLVSEEIRLNRMIIQ